MAQFQVNQGTQTELLTGTMTNGTLVGIMRLDIGTGVTASPWGGTTTIGTVLGAGTLTNLGSVTNFGTGKEVTTIANLTNGSINVLTGTVTSVGTNVGVGTISNLGSITNIGTVKEFANLVTGTLASLGTLPGIGTITNIGSVTNFGTGKEVTTVANLTNGSINVLTGTINSVGTLPGIGTLTNVGSVTNVGTAKEVTTVANLTNGSVNLITGTVTNVGTTVGIGTLSNIGSVNTVTTVSNLTVGSVRMTIGTLTTGTLQNLVSGTVNVDPTPATISPLTFGTLGTAGGSFFATVSAASGAGTKHYVTGLSVIGQAGTADVRILAGSSIQGTGVLGAGNVVPGGGFVRDFSVPFATGTNSELIYHFVGAGSAFIIVNYWKGA